MHDRMEGPEGMGGRSSNSELLWLLGQPELEDYLDFVKRKVIGGDELPPNLLADEWRAANDLFHELERAEAGLADSIERRPIDSSLLGLANELQADRYYKAAFDALPATIEMVELDKLIVSQNHVAPRFAEERARFLGRTPTPETLFRFCLPLVRQNPPVQIRRLSSNRYLLSSDSTDLRVQDAMLLRPEQCAGINSNGPIAAMVGLAVGFGSNFMTAIRSDNRLLLNNGYHRAYGLRALGITHAPCIVETVTRLSELRLTASESVTSNPAFFFRASRPPLLMDFFNPALTKRLLVRPMETMIEVEVKTRSWTSTEIGDPPRPGS